MEAIKIDAYAIGIDLGGTNIKAGLVNFLGEPKFIKEIPTEKEKGYEYIINNVKKLINYYLNKEGLKIKGVGLALPGSVDDSEGECIYCPNLDWRNINIKRDIEADLGIKVRLINDANAACLGDYFYGSAKGYKNIVYLTLGTGVGSAFIIDDKLLLGSKKVGAEAGHMIIEPRGYACSCGSRGCLETLVSASAIVRRTKEKMKNTSTLLLEYQDSLSTEIIFDAYRKNDALAEKIIEETKEYLAIGISNLINIFNSEIVILAGGVTKSQDVLLKGLKEKVQKFAYPTVREFSLAVSSYEENAGVIGAGSLLFKSLNYL